MVHGTRTGYTYGCRCAECYKCQSDYMVKYRKSDHARRLRNIRERVRYGNRRAVVNEAKNKPCADCGNSYPPECMDFDHLPGTVKRTNVGSSISSLGLPSIRLEIEKCEVVCANCHRVRTRKRREEKLGSL